RLADAATAEFRPHEDVLEIDSVTAAEGREVEKPDREAGRLAVPFGQVAIESRLRRKQRRGDLLRRGIDLVLQVLVVGKLADEREDERGVGRLRAADGEGHTATSALICGCAS